MKNYSYKVEDTNRGVFATVELPEGTFKVEIKRLPFNRHTGNRIMHKVVGNYPSNYTIGYSGVKLDILEVNDNEWQVGQEVDHRAFGKGIITRVDESALRIKFAGQEEEKNIMKSIITNFLK